MCGGEGMCVFMSACVHERTPPRPFVDVRRPFVIVKRRISVSSYV